MQAAKAGIEDMDVDAFMNGGMFGLDPDEDGKEYDEGDDVDEETEDEDGDEEEDEEEDGDELMNGGDGAADQDVSGVMY
jgi:hypothetical protein